jgi:hypothetical protein
MGAIGDIFNWYRREGHLKRYYFLVEQLMPHDPDEIDPAPEITLMGIVCRKTGLAPTEWKKLSTLERLPWLTDAANLKDVKEGPVLPQHFLWNGEKTKLEPIPWRLLDYMWKLDNASDSDVESAVWGEGERTSDASFASAISRVNTKLEAAKCRRHLSKKNRTILWNP